MGRGCQSENSYFQSERASLASLGAGLRCRRSCTYRVLPTRTRLSSRVRLRGENRVRTAISTSALSSPAMHRKLFTATGAFDSVFGDSIHRWTSFDCALAISTRRWPMSGHRCRQQSSAKENCFMTPGELPHREASKWLRQAAKDLAAPKGAGGGAWRSVFHSQQAAEKAIKGLLTFR